MTAKASATQSTCLLMLPLYFKLILSYVCYRISYYFQYFVSILKFSNPCRHRSKYCILHGSLIYTTYTLIIKVGPKKSIPKYVFDWVPGLYSQMPALIQIYIIWYTGPRECMACYWIMWELCMICSWFLWPMRHL